MFISMELKKAELSKAQPGTRDAISAEVAANKPM